MVATALPVDFSGRVAVVTGAARGIGAGIAARLRAAGGRVWLVDVDPAALAARAAELGCETICADVRDGDALRAHARRIHDSDGGLDFLVNSAGLLTTGAFDRTDAAQWQRLIDVNLGGIFHCVQGFVPLMRGGGSIVNIASVSAQRGGGALGNVWYGASKAAVVAATMGLARELGPRRIRVNAISPAVVETDMTRDVLTPQLRDKALARVPLGRLAHAEDIAEAVVFLCSDAAGFVTGATLPVDGGFLTT